VGALAHLLSKGARRSCPVVSGPAGAPALPVSFKVPVEPRLMEIGRNGGDHRGVVIHPGDITHPLGPDALAVPLASL
jgi:hypothetical protein